MEGGGLDVGVGVGGVTALFEDLRQVLWLGGFGDLEAGDDLVAGVEGFDLFEFFIQFNTSVPGIRPDGVGAAVDALVAAHAPAVQVLLDLGAPGVGGEFFDQVDRFVGHGCILMDFV